MSEVDLPVAAAAVHDDVVQRPVLGNAQGAADPQATLVELADHLLEPHDLAVVAQRQENVAVGLFPPLVGHGRGQPQVELVVAAVVGADLLDGPQSGPPGAVADLAGAVEQLADLVLRQGVRLGRAEEEGRLGEEVQRGHDTLAFRLARNHAMGSPVTRLPSAATAIVTYSGSTSVPVTTSSP